MNLFIKKAISVLLVSVMMFGITPLAGLVGFELGDLFSITANAAEENVNSEAIDDEINIYHRVYDETSEYGLSSYHWEDEDGNVVELDNTESPMLYSQAATYATLPSYYSSVDEGYVTPIENQFDTGTCWAFAALSTLGSYGLKTGIANSYEDADFSETHLAYFSGNPIQDYKDPLFDKDEYGEKPYDSGGYWYKAFCYLSAGMGIAPQSTYYYPAYVRPIYDEKYRYDHSSGFISSAEMISETRNISLVKSAIYNYGAVCAQFYSTLGGTAQNSGYESNDEWNAETCAYYLKSNYGTKGNHAISIVGWDDNFSKGNFIQQPSYDGAWLVKNSWGTSFGDEGYFWISYYDAVLCRFTRYSYVSGDSYDNIYQYNLESQTSVSQSNVSTVQHSNVFQSKNNEMLEAIGFVTNQNSVQVTIDIYKGLPKDHTTPVEGILAGSYSTIAGYQGYHTFELDDIIELETDEFYSVVLTYETGGTCYIPYDSNENYSKYSYINFNINDPDWTMVKESGGSSSYVACIKAFTNTIPEPTDENACQYTVNYYIRNFTNDGYDLATTEIHTGYAGETARASTQLEKGLTYVESLSTVSGTIVEDGSLVLSVYASRNRYRLYLDYEDGFKTLAFYYGQEIVIPEIVKTGYTNNWYISKWDYNQSAFVKKSVPKTMPPYEITVTGEYVANTHYVYWVVEGKTVSTVKYSYGDTIEILEDPVREHGTFLGWDKTIPSTMPDNDLTFTAEFEWEKYTVTWNWEDGTQTDIVEYGKPITRPTVPDLDTGYTFYNWGAAVPSVMPASNLTFTATYTPKKFTAYYYLDDELVQTKIFTVEHPLSSLKPKVTTSTLEGYEIIWNDDYEIQPNDIVITGYYSPIEYSISFVADGKTISTQFFNVETLSDFVVTVPEVPQKEGYLNARWSDYSLKLDNIVVKAEYDLPCTILLQKQRTMNLDDTVRITLSCNYEPNRKIWTSSNTSVATVDNKGNITAVGKGVCEITVTCYGKDDWDNEMNSSATITIIVKDKSTAKSFKERFRELFDEFFEVKLYDFAVNFKEFMITLFKIAW